VGCRRHRGGGIPENSVLTMIGDGKTQVRPRSIGDARYLGRRRPALSRFSLITLQ